MSDQKYDYEFFLSHVQREAATVAVQLAHGLGVERCWLDRHMADKSVQAMHEGVRSSRCFLCIVTPAYFESAYCIKEIQWALANKKPILTLYQSGANIGAILAAAPETVDDGDGGRVALRSRLQAIDAIMIDASDAAYFSVGLTKIQQRTGGFRIAPTPVAAASRGAPPSRQGVRNGGVRARAVKAAELVGHDTEDKNLREIVQKLAASVAGSMIDQNAPMLTKLELIERELRIA